MAQVPSAGGPVGLWACGLDTHRLLGEDSSFFKTLLVQGYIGDLRDPLLDPGCQLTPVNLERGAPPPQQHR